MTAITEIHKNRFTEIRENLKTIGSEEWRFIKIELMFYEMIAISRTYGNNVGDNILLASLKQLENKQYKDTQSIFRKRSQRERAIVKFIIQLNNILNLDINKS